MKTLKSGAFVLGLMAGAFSTWFTPYNELEIQGLDYRIIMAVSALFLSFGYRRLTATNTFNTGLFLGAGIIFALVLRIIFDITFQTMAHDLWPLEIAIFVVIAFPSAFIGAYLAELLQWSKRSDLK